MEWITRELRRGYGRLASLTATPLVAVVAGCLLLCADDVWARAGGGGNYTGGGGGSRGGGGGGDGEMIVWLVYLAIRYPQIGVPLLVVAAVGMVVKHRINPNNTTTRAIRSLEGQALPGAGDDDVSGITARDPAFDSAAFLTWVQRVDAEIQDAWSKSDMNPVRNYLSDGMYRTFSTQLAIMAHQGRRNAVADHQVMDCRIVAVSQDRHFDTLHVSIDASARDVEVDANLSYDDAMAKAARQPVIRYREIWSFLRKPGAGTLNDRGFSSGTCPNCGAPLEQVQACRCAYCQALVNSGDYDWVLAEITQPEEWRMGSVGDVPGMDELVAKDGHFNRQVAEDRATYVFWRWLEASITGSKVPLAKCASSVMQDKVLSKGAVPHYLSAVGSVDLVDCRAGNGDEQRDVFQAKIRWSSAASPDGHAVNRQTVLRFSRHVAPTVDVGLSHARCPECQGPLAENDDLQCEYCGAQLAGSTKDWTLEMVRLPFELGNRASRVEVAAPSEEEDIPAYAIPDLGRKSDRNLLLMAMASVVMADGVVTRKERKLLKMAAKRWQIPFETVNPVLYGQISQEEIKGMMPREPGSFVDGLIGAALVDGRIDASEQKLIVDVGTHVGMSPAAVKNRMNALAKIRRVNSVG